jgi:hypothetical protein
MYVLWISTPPGYAAKITEGVGVVYYTESL